MRIKTAALVAMLLLVVASGAQAGTIVWDYSPATANSTGTIGYYNEAAGQNFADSVVLGSDTWITGMDIYALELWQGTGGSIGTQATIRIRTNPIGSPIAEFTELIAAIDTVGAGGSGAVRKYVDFTTPYLFSAGTTYWVSMSGTSESLWQMGLSSNPPGDSTLWQYSGTTHRYTPQIGDMAFRLHGSSIAVPLPSAAWAGLGLLGVIGAVRRYRKRTAA